MEEEIGTLLVVDDNEMNRDMLSRRLIRRGHRVDTAEDGQRALDLIEANHYDGVLLDIMMPGIDGFEVLRRLRERFSSAELPIIMVTAKDDSADVVNALNMGANDYVTKPLDFQVVLARVQTQLQLKRLSESKDQFLQIASHDLKSPLTAILLAGSMVPELIAVGEPMTEQAHQILGRIEARAREMQRIIEDFLDFQAIEDGRLEAEMEPADLNRIAEEVVKNNAAYAEGKGIVLIFEPAEDLPAVHLDPAKISQVAQNLIGNAIKFSDPETQVVVRTGAEDHTVRVEVTDSGPGLTEDDLAKTFTKYARLSNSPTGGEKSSGLGLFISKRLIELQGGFIGVRNNPDKGATFWFGVPVAPEQSASDSG